MTKANLLAGAFGTAIGLFLALGSAYILGRSLKMMSEPDSDWSMGQAAGMGTLWMTKLGAGCIAIYYAQKAGISTLYLGLGLPVGIMLGAYLGRGFIREKK